MKYTYMLAALFFVSCSFQELPELPVKKELLEERRFGRYTEPSKRKVGDMAVGETACTTVLVNDEGVPYVCKYFDLVDCRYGNVITRFNEGLGVRIRHTFANGMALYYAKKDLSRTDECYEVMVEGSRIEE